MQVFNDADHYVSLCRENAIIKNVGPKLTNLINGSAYGLMEWRWSPNEIKNFGEMLLYFTLRQCIIERPAPIFPDDVKMRKKLDFKTQQLEVKCKYELQGILDYIVDL